MSHQRRLPERLQSRKSQLQSSAAHSRRRCTSPWVMRVAAEYATGQSSESRSAAYVQVHARVPFRYRSCPWESADWAAIVSRCASFARTARPETTAENTRYTLSRRSFARPSAAAPSPSDRDRLARRSASRAPRSAASRPHRTRSQYSTSNSSEQTGRSPSVFAKSRQSAPPVNSKGAFLLASTIVLRIPQPPREQKLLGRRRTMGRRRSDGFDRRDLASLRRHTAVSIPLRVVLYVAFWLN